MRILVTGIAGYVGSICAEVLLERGHTVVGLDNLSEGHRQAIPQAAEFWERDLNDLARLDEVFPTHRIEAVMHFAAEARVETSMRDPNSVYVANVAGGIRLLDAMGRHGVRKMIFSSTAAVYGEPEHVPIPEDHRKAPINPYGRSKLLFEQLLADYQAYAGLQCVSLRYFNAAGASVERGEDHRNETHLIPRLLEVALGKRERFQISGDDYPTPDGSCIRDFVHVLDIAEAHVLALERLEDVAGEAFNIGNARGHSVKEVLETARRVTRKPIPTVTVPRRPGDPAVLVASSEKIHRGLGWKPRYPSLESIVESAWAWRQKFPSGYTEMS